MTCLAYSGPCIGVSRNLDKAYSSYNHNLEHDLVGRETQIMAAARSGSAAAFDELQRKYSSRLFRTILRITRNREDAEDALQETFLHAYLALGRFEGRSSVYSWLTRIAINTALMILRRRRSRPEVSRISSFDEVEGYSPLEIRDTSHNPEQLCDLRQRSDYLLHAIGKLEPSLRGAIEIQMTGEYSLKDIADTLQISVAAVKARLFRARARLARRASIHSTARKQVRC